MIKNTICLAFAVLCVSNIAAENILTGTNKNSLLFLADNSTQQNHSLHKTRTNASKNTVSNNKVSNRSKSIFPVYVPPFRGAPSNRIGGGTRGTNKKFEIVSLSPDHIGLTTKKQPKLYFYLPTATNNPIVFTLVDENMEEPLIETNLKIDAKGIQVIDISTYHVQLKEKIVYQWYVSLTRDPEHPSLDIVSGGSIQYTPASSILIDNISKTSANYEAFEYAKAGIWYETVSSIIQESVSGENEENTKSQLSALLNQVGIKQKF